MNVSVFFETPHAFACLSVATSRNARFIFFSYSQTDFFFSLHLQNGGSVVEYDDWGANGEDLKRRPTAPDRKRVENDVRQLHQARELA